MLLCLRNCSKAVKLSDAGGVNGSERICLDLWENDSAPVKFCVVEWRQTPPFPRLFGERFITKIEAEPSVE